MRTKIQEFLIELNDKSEALFVEGFDDAIIGVEAESERVIYDKDKMIKILVEEGMNDLEAIEYLEYNVWGAYVGVHTPLYIDTLSDDI
jgi:hypothetical protein